MNLNYVYVRIWNRNTLSRYTDPLYENDPLSHQNYIRLSQLDKPGEFLPSFNWTNYLRSILSPINYKINWRTEIYVSEVGLLQRLAKTIEKLTDQQIADYLGPFINI
ncbi:unnamed protein product [Meloidogyne enterolobii]|uniref:Uncharacterized protein n=1 Tax=Meloidogyne enterolobii TaxID=390850 RepID=A0ACB0YBV7_MELEN